MDAQRYACPLSLPEAIRSGTTWVGVVLAFIVTGLLTGCASQLNAPQEPSPTLPQDLALTVLKQQHYSPPDWPQALYADVYLPTAQTPSPRPAVLMVHGGGWEGRTKQDMTPIAKRLAHQGFVVVNIDYRFAPAYRFPAQLYDLQQAMHWIHDNAAQWRVDPARIAGLGYSSGAHLISLLGLTAGQGGELDRPYGGETTKLAAVVAGGTPTNLFKFDDGRLVVQFLGGTRLEVPDQYAAASPLKHVSSEAPPFFLFHGTLDSLVPVEHAKTLHHALLDAGVHSELYLQRLRGHITGFLTRGGAIDAATDFLARELYSQSE